MSRAGHRASANERAEGPPSSGAVRNGGPNVHRLARIVPFLPPIAFGALLRLWNLRAQVMGDDEWNARTRMHMGKLTVFNQVTLDGYFTDKNGDMSWAHKSDPEWDAFVGGNASSGGTLLFGRVTYDMMVSYWPTPTAKENNPVVAEQMNKLPKVVFSRTMDRATWSNTKLVKDDIAGAVRKMKGEPGNDMVILGSGSIVSQLTQEGLIDVYQIIVNPIVLGGGRTLFEGVKEKLNLRLTGTRAFENGNVLLSCETTA